MIERDETGAIRPHRFYLIGWFGRDDGRRRLEEFSSQGDERQAAAEFASARSLGLMQLEVREITYAGAPALITVRPAYQAV